MERRYSQTEKEALALVWACERFNIYVYGRKFELETDHKPLECIFGRLSKPSARIERWVLRLQGYDYRVVYRPGKANIADSLSRLNQCNPKDTIGEEFDFVKAVAEESLPVALTAKQVELVSDSDPEIASLRQYILSEDWYRCRMTAYVCVKDELCVRQTCFARHKNCCSEGFTGRSLASCPRETSGHRKNEGTFKDKGLVAKD